MCQHGNKEKFLIFLSLWDIGYGINQNRNSNWQQRWFAKWCQNLRNKTMSSWYSTVGIQKKNFFVFWTNFLILDILCWPRSDTALYDLAPIRTGKLGRPKKRGDHLNLTKDFSLSKKIGGYFMVYCLVLTNLFGNRKVLAYTTATEQE